MKQTKEQEYEVELELEERKEVSITKSILSWILHNLKFLLIPGYRLEELSIREFEYEKTISKRKFIQRLKSPLTMLGILIVFTISTFAIFPEWLSQYTFEEANGAFYGAWQPASLRHPLGTRDFGRDILARLIYGARTSLTIALPSIGFSVVVGVVFGVIAGYYGGWVDSVIMRIMDVFLAFPSLIFALVFVSIWGPRMELIMLAFGILGVPCYSRLIRGVVLQARQLPYIEAARTSGSGNWRIMFRHILPNTIQSIIISLTFNSGGVILALAGLAFLG
ncbi:MAG: ABC transporter permease, partial [Promethearchaeota archaeon]